MLFGNPQPEKPPVQDFTKPAPKGMPLFWAILKRDILKVCLVNLLFLLFSLPVVTLPAAYTAMTKVSLSLLRCPTCYVWQEFWAAFRRELGRATLAGWAYLLVMGLAVTALRVYATLAATASLWYLAVVFCLLCLLFLAMMGFYLFPLIGGSHLPLKAAIKNAAGLTLLCWKNSLLTLLAATVFVVLVEATLPMSILFMLLLAVGLLNMGTTWCALQGYEKYGILVDKQAAKSAA